MRGAALKPEASSESDPGTRSDLEAPVELESKLAVNLRNLLDIAFETNDVDALRALVEQILIQLDYDVTVPVRCKNLFERQFSSERAVQQIVRSFA